MKARRTEQKIDSIFTSLAVLSALTANDRIVCDGYPVDGIARRDAIMYELDQLTQRIGFTDEKINEMASNVDWSETSPEQIEFNNALGYAMQKFLIAAGGSKNEDN
ncbi:hypothetical protein [Lactobacillus amylolyticus]|uniref:hypothetical protein n=1 Tax=Lactobacillus amylolyticus TaxID=83683 RepID=UPI0024905D5A|nr:hypothetical protein [Lactobacillus amylolyticus]